MRTLLNWSLVTVMLAVSVPAQGLPLHKCLSSLPSNALKQGWRPFTTSQSIPPAYWGAPITAMKPLRVLTDRVNVAVVTEQTPTHASGFYFVLPESSYMPTNAHPGRAFVCRSVGENLRFRFLRSVDGPDDTSQRTPSVPVNR